MKVPVGWLAGGWIGGIAVVLTGGSGYEGWWWLGAGVLGIAGGWLCLWRWRMWTTTCTVLAFFAGAAYTSWVDTHNVSSIDDRLTDQVGIKLHGVVQSAPEVDGDQLTCMVKVYRLEVRGAFRRLTGEKVLLRLRLQSQSELRTVRDWTSGTRLSVNGVRLTRPDPARNPGGFDARAFYRRQFVHWIASADGLRGVSAEQPPPWDVFAWADRIRRSGGDTLAQLYPEEISGLIRGLVLGERNAVPEEIDSLFAEWGLTHLLAISGMNVAVFVAGVYGLLTRLRLTREVAGGLTIVSLPIFAWVTGAEASVVRASLMAGFALVATVFGMWHNRLSFLFLAGWLMLLWNPYQLLEAGFQLTCLITLGLLVAVEPLSSLFPLPWKWANQWLAVTLIAHLVSFPVTITFFYDFPTGSWWVNLWIVPIVGSVVFPLALLSLMLGWIAPVWGAVPAWICTQVTKGLLWLLERLSEEQGMLTSWSPPSWQWCMAYAAACVYALFAWTGNALHPRRHRWCSAVMITGLIFYSYHPFYGEREARITFLDVGQGDCAVIETPRGQVIVVDGGGMVSFPQKSWQRRHHPYDVGEKTVVPYLRYRGIRQIDYLIMTHGDADHIGGLQKVAEQFPVRLVLRNPHPPRTATERQLMRTLIENGARIAAPSPGTAWTLEPGVVWQFLHPDPAHLSTDGWTNNDSIVFLLQIQHFRLLMTGDIEQEAEEDVVEKWRFPPVDVLKVAHHGSRTSTGESWLAQVRPGFAVISVGRHNRFGHPAPEVIRRLQSHRIHIWRTDRHGAVTIRIRPAGWTVETMLPVVR
ncbi:DNA internalization-related competence protein ComEC/Rec2 [Polycladomyces abyssicola]|uniref:DNA internalization-related competence protein ComEC/Rec2 n=1 Tax=Polycladomyces abyssicola TaxID=1125966 RepID=A0A8D5ZNY9_9BACL|nr:DNA internalization-related competence protein ComEC/Rec2 [Polycladomyces abyssicola]BCU82457.1 DNA internalization-related competence protein ComEC/Rec2 [Polycladomyces abyssicola]